MAEPQISKTLLLGACLGMLLTVAPAAQASNRHGTRTDQAGHRNNDRDRGHGGKKNGHGNKGSDLGDKPIAGNSCAKRVRELKKELARQSYLPRANGKCMGEDEMWAIDAFQRQEQIRTTGKADRKTLKRLDKSER
ncbi:MAG: hypothetical protein QOG62_908, partial [Thermoleophilaceae bacterium]|nr:hypothetical protein [Thermoleophilaceae bacterium]